MTHVSIWIWILAGIVGVIVIGQFVRRPTTFFLWALRSVAVGCLFVFAINWIGTYLHFHLPFNPATALTAGILGIPGVIALIALQLVLFPA